MLLRIVYSVALLVSASLAMAETREEFLGKFAEKAKNSEAKDASDLVDAAFLAEDMDQVRILLGCPGPHSYIRLKFRRLEPSKIADQVMISLITEPWYTDRNADGSLRSRNGPSGDDFLNYALYMQKRLGHSIVEPSSEDQLLKVASSREERTIIAREFERELVKAGLLAADERTIPDPSSPPSTPGPRKDPASDNKPPASRESTEIKSKAEQQGSAMKWWLALGSILLLGVAGYFGLRKKSGSS